MMRASRAIPLCLAVCVAAGCGKTSAIPGSPSAVSCSLAVSPTSQAVSRAGGSFHAAVSGSCAWSTTSDAGWIVVTHGQGSDIGTVTYDVLPNTGAGRQSRLMIGDRSLVVTQAGPDPPAPAPAPAPPTPAPDPAPPAPTPPDPPSGEPCTYTLAASATRVPAGGGTLRVDVKTNDACQWSASSPAAWITLPSGQHTGSGSVTAGVGANSGAARSGQIVVGSASLVITQDAAPLPVCAFTLTPSRNPVPPQAGDFTLDVSTNASCKWEASSATDWISVSSMPMAGNGRIPFGVRPNTGDPRAGRIVVGTASVVISQEGCVSGVGPQIQKLPSGAGGGKLGVTAPDACGWSVKAPGWILGLPDSGKGAGGFGFRVEPNPGPDRSGIIEIGGQKVEVTQAGFYRGALGW